MIIESSKQKSTHPQLYKYFAYFLIFGFLGWFFETSYVWLRFGRFTYRGYFFVQQPLGHYFTFIRSIPLISRIPLVLGLPFIEIYGLGGVIMVAFFGNLKDKPMKLFFTGMVAMTLFELAGSYLCTALLKIQYWNYSNNFMNYQGRICLQSSVAWGILSVIGVSIITPRIDRQYNELQGKKSLKTSITILIIYVIFCAMTKYCLAPLVHRFML